MSFNFAIAKRYKTKNDKIYSNVNAATMKTALLKPTFLQTCFTTTLDLIALISNPHHVEKTHEFAIFKLIEFQKTNR